MAAGIQIGKLRISDERGGGGVLILISNRKFTGMNLV